MKIDINNTIWIIYCSNLKFFDGIKRIETPLLLEEREIKTNYANGQLRCPYCLQSENKINPTTFPVKYEQIMLHHQYNFTINNKLPIVPPIFTRIDESLTREKYFKINKKPKFLQKTVNVCDKCYMTITVNIIENMKLHEAKLNARHKIFSSVRKPNPSANELLNDEATPLFGDEIKSDYKNLMKLLSMDTKRANKNEKKDTMFTNLLEDERRMSTIFNMYTAKNIIRKLSPNRFKKMTFKSVNNYPDSEDSSELQLESKDEFDINFSESKHSEENRKIKRNVGLCMKSEINVLTGLNLNPPDSAHEKGSDSKKEEELKVKEERSKMKKRSMNRSISFHPLKLVSPLKPLKLLSAVTSVAKSALPNKRGSLNSNNSNPPSLRKHMRVSKFNMIGCPNNLENGPSIDDIMSTIKSVKNILIKSPI